MKKQNIFDNFIIISLVFVVITTSISVGIFVWKWNQPRPSNLALPTYAPTQTKELSQFQSVNPVFNAEITPQLIPAMENFEIASTATPLPPGIPIPPPLCGGPETMMILAIGIDADDDYRYGLADIIRVVRVDFVEPSVVVLSLPRDIWVRIPEISDHREITHGKLNQAYFYGTPGMGYYDGSGYGAGLLALTLALNFELYVDRYGTINMDTMEEVIDTLGGIDIYLPYDVDGNKNNFLLGYFPAGYHHFNGDETIRFSRIRAVDSDLERIKRQSMVLSALREKIISPSILPKIPKIIRTFQDTVLTDFSAGDFAVLTCLIPQIEEENLIFVNIPENLLTGRREYDAQLDANVFVWDPDLLTIKQLLSHFQEGTWPVK